MCHFSEVCVYIWALLSVMLSRMIKNNVILGVPLNRVTDWLMSYNLLWFNCFIFSNNFLMLWWHFPLFSQLQAISTTFSWTDAITFQPLGFLVYYIMYFKNFSLGFHSKLSALTICANSSHALRILWCRRVSRQLLSLWILDASSICDVTREDKCLLMGLSEIEVFLLVVAATQVTLNFRNSLYLASQCLCPSSVVPVCLPLRSVSLVSHFSDHRRNRSRLTFIYFKPLFFIKTPKCHYSAFLLEVTCLSGY